MVGDAVLKTRLPSKDIHQVSTKRGITREKANEIAMRLLPLYKDTFHNPKPGQAFHELYNTQSITPKQEWQDCYRRAKETLTKLGLTFGPGPYD